MFAIYEHPADYPDAFVMRRWVIDNGKAQPTTDMQTGPTLEAVRALVPVGYVCIPRHADDDPVIVETWI